MNQAVTIDTLVERARERLQRVDPDEAARRVRDGALLVDIRPSEQRRIEGAVPGAIVIERNVLEWRLDPASAARIPEATSHDVEILVLCSEGYASSLAAATLQDLGLHRATDVAGGARAWLGLSPTEHLHA
ncbi:MAG TPA: rhodanese-like domain-containing protein [Acidimicrobiia bacterium]